MRHRRQPKILKRVGKINNLDIMKTLYCLLFLFLGFVNLQAQDNQIKQKPYSNLEYGFSFNYPSNWQTYSKDDAMAVGANGLANFVIGIRKIGENLDSRIAISIETGGPTTFSEEQYRQYASMLTEQSSSMMSQFKAISSKIIKIDDNTALEYIFSYDPSLGRGLDKIRQITIVKNGKAYSLSCGSPINKYDTTNKEVFDVIIKSFSFH